MSQPIKVMISAYACEPGKGSEPEVGWRVATEMARCCEVCVVTRSNNRAGIQAGLAIHQGPKPLVIYYDLPYWCIWLKRHGLPVAAYYWLWQLGVRRSVRNQSLTYDLIHHVTFNGLQLPGCWSNEASPVVLGPLGGGMVCPTGYLRLFGSARVGEMTRGFIVRRLHWLPWWRKLLSDATVVLAANQETASLIQPLRSEPVPVMLETSVARDAVVGSPAAKTSGPKLRFLWLGNLIPRKAAILGVEAMAQVTAVRDDIELVIAGAGPEEAALRKRVSELKMNQRVFFLGKIPKEKVNALLDNADAFLFTSVRDTSGNVVLEAMSRSLPVIAINHQGIREICDESTAILVEPGTIGETVEAIARAILRLSDDDKLRQQLGSSAQQRILDRFTWDSYRKQMHGHYQDALRKKSISLP